MAVVLLAGVVVFAAPWWTRDRVLPASIPSPAALFALAYVPVDPGQEACFDNAAIESHSDVATVRVATGGQPGPPLEMRLRGDGWSQTVALPGGYPDGATLRAPLRPPHRSVLARVCLADRGSAPVQFFASADRTRSRSIAEVSGRPQGKSIWFALYERKPVSLLARLGVTAGRIEAFRPGVVGRWLVYLLAAALAALLPVAVVLGYGSAVRADELSAGGSAGSTVRADEATVPPPDGSSAGRADGGE
jgi:hypothetical protein